MANVYGPDTNWENEYKYLSKLAETGTEGQKKWAQNQMNVLNDAYAQYLTGNDAGYGAKPAAVDNVSNNYINEIYQQQIKARRAAIESAYKQNTASLDRTAEQIPVTYQSARNQAAGQAAISQKNFDEYAAASGLNSGAAAQARLASNTALQSTLGSISQAEAQALADIELQRRQLEDQYRAEIAAAIAESNAEKARTLYNEYVRQQEALADTKRVAADEAYRQRTLAMQEADTDYERKLRAAEIAYKLYGDTSLYNQLFGISAPSYTAVGTPSYAAVGTPPYAADSPKDNSEPEPNAPTIPTIQATIPTIQATLNSMKAAGASKDARLAALLDAYKGGLITTSAYMTMYNQIRDERTGQR